MVLRFLAYVVSTALAALFFVPSALVMSFVEAPELDSSSVS
jgi:hypothetical protein